LGDGNAKGRPKLTEKKATAPNSTYKKLAAQYSADTFLVNQTLVLRINICGKNRQLLVAANRYLQCKDDREK
jgi:hypothetical protein